MLRPTAVSPPVYTESSWALLAGTRFVLAAIVFLTHLEIFPPTMPAALGVVLDALNSRAAVIGFLLISGLSIGASYRQRAEGYYARRFLRIYPLYFVAVALAQALVYLVGSPYPVAYYTFTAAGWKTALGNFLLLQDFAVIPLPYNVALWTLSIEVFFYLWAPLLARLRPAVTVGLIVASMAMFALRPAGFLYGELAARFAWPWLTGFLLAYRGWTPVTVSLAVAGSFLPLLRPDVIGGALCWLTVGGTVAVLWAAARVRLPGRVRTVLNFLGEQSYPLYLFHLPLGLAFYHYAGLRRYWSLAAAVLLTIPVLDLVCDHWLKTVFWKGLVARLTGLWPARITSATEASSPLALNPDSRMPSNIEIKARVHDPERKRTLAERLAGAPPVCLLQEDTFFPCAHGRLKLRQLSGTHGELIAYRRADVSGPKQSDYLIHRTDAPAELCAVLAGALGVGVVVTKTRLLFLVGQTRVHLDEVAGLGSFLELEVVLADGQLPSEGQRIAREIMAALEVNEADLLDCAYADLLAGR